MQPAPLRVELQDVVCEPGDDLKLFLVPLSLGPDLRDEDRREELAIMEHLQHEQATPVIPSDHPDIDGILVDGGDDLVHPCRLHIVPGQPNIMLLHALGGHPGFCLRDS